MSVLASIRGLPPARGTPVPLLRPEPQGLVPEVQVKTSPGGRAAEGRYRLIGEIARGGVGVVWKGHDVDLGRDVAMKVLREEFNDDPGVIQRFVEEAQIGGQLQHPGIVPVYEIGLRADGRPYFTMKLVRGRTLSALLAQRGDPSQERSRFLRIFESVCRTMAYAHARGVVHRDLKPANVMVGSFGEVLVLDWGLAKAVGHGGVDDERKANRDARDRSSIRTIRAVAGSGQSLVGSVFGTPRYMSPEQAGGRVDALDERSDVFSLGAILCEILTGAPPYAGRDEDVISLAAVGNVSEAAARLDASGADPEIVAIAKSCLSAVPGGRSRDAGVLAERVSRHLAGVEERARAAITAEAEAQADFAEEQATAEHEHAAAEEARAEAERSRAAAAEERARIEQERAKAERARLRAEQEAARAAGQAAARRRTFAVAGAVVVLLVAGGGGVLWAQSGTAQRTRDAGAAVDGALADATARRGRAAAQSDLGPWTEAVDAAKRARALADAEDTPRASRERATRVLAEVEAERKKVAERLDREERDRRMVETLAD